MPEWALNEPIISPGDDFFISAYFDLSIGEPISWIDRIRYADRKGLEPDVADAFSCIIRELDSVYLEWKSAREKAIAKQGKNNGKFQR